MKKKILVFVFSFLILLLITNIAFAHSGMTDAAGGHWDDNEYHYHCGGNPAHKHYGGICPYNRIPADTSSNKGNYGNGNSGTRKENTMELWEIFLLGAVVLFVVIAIFNGIKEKIQENKRAKEREQERKDIKTSEKITELSKKIEALEKENKELERVANEKSGIIASLDSLQKEQSGELKRLKKENEKLNDKLEEAKNTVADANFEVLNTRKEMQQLQSMTIPQDRALNDELASLKKENEILNAENKKLRIEKTELSRELKVVKNAEIKKFKTEAWNKFFRKAEKVLEEEYDLNSFFESIGTSRFEKAMLENVEMHNLKITAEFVPQSDKKATENYLTSLKECTCKDYINTNLPCKHMIHLAYTIGALQMKSKKFDVVKKQLIESIKELGKQKEKLEKEIKQKSKKLAAI